MASFQGGTYNSYESIAPYRLYLDLSSDDKEFMTGIKNPLTSAYNPIEGLSQNVVEYIGGNSRVKFVRKPENTAYERISRNPNMKRFKKLIDDFKLKHLLTGEKTFLIPLDKDNFTWNFIYNQITYGVVSVEDIVRFHIINYMILPVQMLESKLRVDTLLPSETILIDGVNKYPRILYENSLYGTKDNYILKTEMTDNGWIYAISKPLYPYKF